MTATIHPETAMSYGLEGWEIQAAEHLLQGARFVPPAERIAAAQKAGLTGVARCMASLAGVTDTSVAAILEASRR